MRIGWYLEYEAGQDFSANSRTSGAASYQELLQTPRLHPIGNVRFAAAKRTLQRKQTGCACLQSGPERLHATSGRAGRQDVWLDLF